tara:strand:- start:120 stop:512 length:393 start_codon:yes stop_codon:yes gene_type:complete
MKILLLTFIIFFNLILSPNSHAKWIKVLELEDGISFYIDFEKIKKVDSFIYWWDLTNYLKPTHYGHSSVKLYRQGDCKKFRYKFLRFYFYQDQMGTGVGKVENPEEKRWQYPHPNSAQSVILKSVCNFYD